MSGWWRRNGWALPVALLALGAAAGPDSLAYYRTYRAENPQQPVGVAADGWARYGAARARLVGVEAATVTDGAGRALPLPPGTAAWQATVELDLPAPDTLGGCTVLLRSTTGRTYSQPQELSAARGSRLGCQPDDVAATGPQRFRIAPRFLLPASERPAAVWITLPTLLPRYAQLPAPAAGMSAPPRSTPPRSTPPRSTPARSTPG